MISWTVCSFCTATGSPRADLFAVPLPRLSCSDPALPDTLTPDFFSLCDGHHPGATPAVAPHPNVHLIESAAVTRCVSAEALPRH